MADFWERLADSLALGMHLSRIAGGYTPRRELRQTLLSAMDDYKRERVLRGDFHSEEEEPQRLAA
jgi:hypothetical protein